MNLKKLFGKRLRELRIQKGLKQHELAALTDYEPNSIGQIEGGHKAVSFKALELFAEKLEVSYYELHDFEKVNTEKSLTNSILREIEGLNKKDLEFILKYIKDFKKFIQ